MTTKAYGQTFLDALPQVPCPSRSRIATQSLADMNLNQLLHPSEQELFHKAVYDFSDRSIRLHASRLAGDLPFAVSQVPWVSFGTASPTTQA